MHHAYDDPYFPRTSGARAKHLTPPPPPRLDAARYYDGRPLGDDAERPAECEPLGMMTGRQLLALVGIGVVLWLAVIGGAAVVVWLLK